MIDYYAHASPLPGELTAEEVAHTAAFLASPLASGITGSVIHVDRGYHAMAVPHDLDRLIAPLAREAETAKKEG